MTGKLKIDISVGSGGVYRSYDLEEWEDTNWNAIIYDMIDSLLIDNGADTIRTEGDFNSDAGSL